jgi:hypothetical protein
MEREGEKKKKRILLMARENGDVSNEERERERT